MTDQLQIIHSLQEVRLEIDANFIGGRQKEQLLSEALDLALKHEPHVMRVSPQEFRIIKSLSQDKADALTNQLLAEKGYLYLEA